MNRLDTFFARRCKRHVVRWLAAVAALLASSVAVQAETVLRIVMNSDLKIIDPIWNTAFVIRDHGYMIYDTLFATDAEGEIRPQMVDTTEVSADKLTYTFTLRDGLKWHDGQPVTAEDCVASIKRWAARDAVGQKLMTFVDRRRGQGRAHPRDQAQGADRAAAAGAGQAQLQRAVHDAQARRRDRSLHPDHRFHRLGPVHLQARAVAARSPRRLCQKSRLQAAPRAGLAAGRRQARQGRPHRMARHARPPAGHQCAAAPARSTSSRRRPSTCTACSRPTRTSSS